MCVDYDPPDVYRESTRRARKQHRCGECGRNVQPGETYRNVAGLSEGYWWTAKQCAQCIEATRWLSIICSGFLFTDVLEELDEHRYEPHPISTVALVRLCSRMRRQWAHHGGLWPVDDVRGLVDRAVAPFIARERERIASIPDPDRRARLSDFFEARVAS